MLCIGVLSVALCAVQVFSFPASARDSADDTKVLKCIVEVISDTLSKPNPVPTSEDCLETLRGDERIISILRHQNLLKELQELAAQGAMERLRKQKKNGGFREELSGILEKQSDEPLPSENAPVRDEEKKQSEEEERKRSSEPPEEDDSAEELESNEISKREDTSEDEEIDNRITDEINEMEPPKDNREDAGEGRTSDEKETVTKKDHEEEEEEKEDPHNDADNEEDDTQREDNSMKIPEDSKSESDASKEPIQDAETTDCAEENPRGDDDTSSKELEDSKRWNKMDELAKELRAKKCAARRSEEDPDMSMKIPPKKSKSEPSSQAAEDQTQWQPSREDSAETEAPMLKRAEEEGSANRKTEEQELESLAAIEAELENVAHKLHDLRRG
ncbi:chromogranin-A isoform 1-T2 [Anomaloglossus baeobatrachus]|uniref:chromogranin-A isoform X1 n=1 Tax=Anomaloglossus baeobatrachus TaxID=238106 RepID=UPI003F4F8E7D